MKSSAYWQPETLKPPNSGLPVQSGYKYTLSKLYRIRGIVKSDAEGKTKLPE